LAKPVGKIVVYFYSNNQLVKKKTINVYGKYRIQLISAFKVLSLLSAVREEHDITHMKIELVNVNDAGVFKKLLQAYSPVPVTIETKRLVVDEVVEVANGVGK